MLVKINRTELVKFPQPIRDAVTDIITPAPYAYVTYAQNGEDLIVYITGDITQFLAGAYTYTEAHLIQNELPYYRYIHGANPSPQFCARKARQIELQNIIVSTTNINGITILLDGDVVSPTEDRPASAVLIKFKLDEIRGTVTTTLWRDKSNNWHTVNAASLETALAEISAATTAIWAKYA